MDEKITTQAEESLESLITRHQDGDDALDAQIVSFQNKNEYILLLNIELTVCLETMNKNKKQNIK